jgi:hypothetical protein
MIDEKRKATDLADLAGLDGSGDRKPGLADDALGSAAAAEGSGDRAPGSGDR